MPAITSIELVAGAAAVHVTVDSQNVALAPGAVSWVVDANLQAVIITPDATGFNFQAPVGMPATNGNATATDTANGAVGVIPVIVSIAPLTFASP